MTAQDAQQTIKFPEGHYDSPDPFPGESRANGEPFDAPMAVLRTTFAKDTPGFALDTPAYLLAVAKYPNGPSLRVRVLALARDQVFKPIWVKRATLGEFKRVEIGPKTALYNWLQTEADVDGITERLQKGGSI
jgi:hypothetical protein